jgi:hypothetical protein
VLAAAGGLLALLARDPAGGAVQPGGQAGGVADRLRAAGQDEDGGLEGDFDVIRVVQQASADPTDERTVAGDQGGKGRLGLDVVGCCSILVAFEQLSVAEAGDRARLEQDPPAG